MRFEALIEKGLKTNAYARDHHNYFYSKRKDSILTNVNWTGEGAGANLGMRVPHT